MYLRGRKSIFYIKLTLFVFCLFFISSSNLQALGVPKVIPKSNLLLHLTFDSAYTSGIKTYDKSGRNNYGTLVSGPLLSPGRVGQSLLFDGVNSRVTVSGSINLITNSFTISHWIKTSTALGQVYTVGNAGGASGYRFGIGGGAVSFLIGDGINMTESSCGSRTVNDNDWHMITGSYDRTNFVFTCYIDGVFVATTSINSSIGSINSTNPTIGKPPCCNAFPGYLDDVRIYNKVLSASEILTLYKTGSNISVKNSDNTNLLGYWPLNGNYNDYSGKRNHFTVNGTCVATSSDAVTGSISATGWGGCGTSPNLLGYLSTGNIFNSATEFTYVVWVKGTGVLWSGSPTFWFTTTATGANLEKYTSSWVTVASGDGGGTSSIWRQMVITKNSTGGVKIYSNGVEIASSTTQSFYTPTSQTLGRYAVYDDGSYHFTGKIDDARLYGRVLSVSEIKELYKMKPASVAPSKTKVSTTLSGPILHYTFDGSKLNSSTSTDSGSTGAHGTLIGGLSAALGKIGQALNFDGVSDYISVGSNMANNDMTIATWIKPRTTTGYIATEGIINSGVRFILYFSSNKVAWSCYDGAYKTAITDNIISANKWTHIVGTIKSGETGGVKIYVNGTLQNTTSTASSCVPTGTLYIGSYIWPIGSYFNGLMDDFRVYNRSLSASEVLNLYKLGGR